jgi:molecular chaperone DnaJ
VQPDERFERRGEDLVTRLDVPFTQAALGATIPYETLDGTEQLSIARGTQPGTTTRFKGHGVHRLNGRGRGDLIVRINVAVPTDLDPDQEARVRELAELRDEPVGEQSEGIFSKVRSAFRA